MLNCSRASRIAALATVVATDPAANTFEVRVPRGAYDPGTANFTTALVDCVSTSPGGGAHNATLHPSGDWLAMLNPRRTPPVLHPTGDADMPRFNFPMSKADSHYTDIVSDDRVLLTFWEDSMMLKISRRDGVLSAAEIWRSPRLRGFNGPTIYRDGFLMASPDRS